MVGVRHVRTLELREARMTDIVERLLERADSYGQSGPSSHHTAALLREAADEIERLRMEREERTQEIEWLGLEVAAWKQGSDLKAAEIKRLRAAIKAACAWFLLPDNIDLTGSDAAYRQLHDALAPCEGMLGTPASPRHRQIVDRL